MQQDNDSLILDMMTPDMSQGPKSRKKSAAGIGSQDSTQVDRVITETTSLRNQLQHNIQMASNLGLDNTKYLDRLKSVN